MRASFISIGGYYQFSVLHSLSILEKHKAADNSFLIEVGGDLNIVVERVMLRTNGVFIKSPSLKSSLSLHMTDKHSMEIYAPEMSSRIDSSGGHSWQYVWQTFQPKALRPLRFTAARISTS